MNDQEACEKMLNTIGHWRKTKQSTQSQHLMPAEMLNPTQKGVKVPVLVESLGHLSMLMGLKNRAIGDQPQG